MTDQQDSAVDRFLSKMEGKRIPYVEVVEDAKNPYCDSCSQPVTPNTRVQAYAVSRVVYQGEVPHGFRVIRMHCPDCKLPRLFFPCRGYDEYLLEHTLDRDWRIRQPALIDVSPESDGIPWDPQSAMEQLFDMPYSQIMTINPEALGPMGVVDILVKCEIDPRMVINDDGSLDMPPDATDRLERTFDQMEEKFGRDLDDAPPQPSFAQKLIGMMEADDE